MIVHITDRAAWREAQAAGWYRHPSLEAEGFLHCSTPAQAVGTANRFFRGQADLVVLCIDETRLGPGAPLRYEAPASADEDPAARFPHLYGPLPVSAVVRVIDLSARADGSFGDLEF